MPSKPAKYGIKSWVACDARSSYAWNMQVYTGKTSSGGPPEKNRGMRVVLDLTGGGATSRATTFSPLTNWRSGSWRGTSLWWARCAKTGPSSRGAHGAEARAGRRVFSSEFTFTPTAALVSYVPKKGRNVVLLSTRHTGPPEISERADEKPHFILDYNRNKGAVRAEGALDRVRCGNGGDEGNGGDDVGHDAATAAASTHPDSPCSSSARLLPRVR
ncbi:hypothetical protein JOQ06_019638 [Pogonophryne albipinna]|uniref:PiggyBac transposable element-derived protein domain-containing protein n=1 Tax=Pogonophryne albipinna TaxID=1090488 RepID=A0AAD6BP18_9TELE|nr:hypothetical protein JOQ06_019638 [Pogonophryne albipinna]